MRTKFCSTILHMSILAAIILPLATNGSEEDCTVVIKVPRNAEYSAVVGATLMISCPVTFCVDSTPTISWIKLEETHVPVNVSPGSRFQSKWETLQRSEGVYVLIILNIERNDSGIYQCRSRQSVGHYINVFVNDSVKPTTDAWTTTELPKSQESKAPLWSNVYCVVGIMGLVFMVVAVYVTSDSLRKGLHCGRRSEKPPDPNDQPSHDALQMDVINESAQ